MHALEDPRMAETRPAPPVRRRSVVMSPADLDEMTLTPEAQVRIVRAIAEESDRAAFAMLFRHFAPRVKTFLMRSGLPSNTAEELAQETMINVWRKASYFDPARAGVATWIFTIARNLRIDHLRQQNRRPPVAEDPSDEGEEPHTGETFLLMAERESRVRKALTQLSEEQMKVVRLSFFGDKAHSEIAAELDIPIGTVKSRIRLAMTHLRSLLDEMQ